MKVLIAFFLAIAVFGAGGYFTYKIYIEPKEKLQHEKQLPPPPPPPDPTVPDFEKCVELQQNAKLIEARAAFTDFIERYPESTKIDDAKYRAGQINSYIFLSSYPAPEKLTYVVQKNDVITRVAAKMRTTPEMILKANDLHGIMLRIGQKLMVSPGDFSVLIDRKNQKVVLLNNGKFFKQYPFIGTSGQHAPKIGASAPKKGAPTPRPPKLIGKVVEKIAWRSGQRVTPFDKDKGEAYADADHWIVISPGGHSLYTDHETTDAPPPKTDTTQPSKPPGGGYGLAPDAMQELAAMLNKNTPVTID